jgi:transcriptional regulator with XRE-family HTH domain
MNGSNGLIDSLRAEFQDKQYRHTFVNEFLDAAIAAQLKALREQRGWTQAELAEHAGMKQSRISLMENVNYSSWSVNTLRKLAETFDVTLAVRFRPFGQTVVDMEYFGPGSLEVASFPNDPIFGASPRQIDSTSDLVGSRTDAAIATSLSVNHGTAGERLQLRADSSGKIHPAQRLA